ncbi:Protein asteroid [Operophtera brumata]|uniref:Protein asteroid n=1 Tax=Operophtera brumata TaxID=104452 RepID=A0A0L7L341_OPEBR|nr:Protein asteroid [Operophtera brumata]
MGVRGLTTYINYNENAFLQTFLLHDSCLIIDGHSLCAQLYRRLSCFSAFGGDYDKFAAYVRNFFKNLRKCNVVSYVIFDGSYEHRKLKTAYSRLRSKINGASRLDPVTQGSLQIFPLLIRDVFIEALSDVSVPYTVCEFEADDEIAAMARHLNCPVLSYDSDFFIYNVLYIPFNTIESKPKLLEDGKIFVLECKIYKVEYMTTYFGGLKEELLPLLATLLGNDYVEKRVFGKFFSELKLPKSKKKKNDQQRCIHGLFKWLQNETLDSALAKILGRLKKNQKDKVLYIMKKSIDGYNRKNCHSLKHFNISKDLISPESVLYDPKRFELTCTNDVEFVPVEEIDIEQEISEDESQASDDGDSSDEEASIKDVGVPDWYAEGIRCNHIPRPYLNLFTHHLYFCSPQAEDYTDDDCFLCNLPILRYAFDILTDFSVESMIYVGRDRNLNYKKITVDQENAIPRLFDISFPELSESQLKSYFHNFLHQKMELLDLTTIELLPSNFQLIMIAILWWVATCSVPLGHVHSLIISYIMLEVVDEKTGTFRGHNYFNNKYQKKLEELRKNKTEFEQTDLLNKNKVQYEDCMIAASALLKHFELDDKIMKKPKTYDVKKMHSFAQFQCCLQQINSLNILCRCPFASTKYSKSINGTFVYNISVKLQNQTEPYTFFKDYLKGATTVLLFYKSICDIYEQCVVKMKIQTVQWSASGKRRRRKKNAELDEINFIVKGFESEVFI